MCKMICAFALAAALGVGAAVGGEGGPSLGQGGGATQPKPKTGESTKDAAARADTQTKTGTIAAKPADAAEGVLAVLKIKPASTSGRRPVRGKAAAEKEETFNLMASGAEEAVKIKELAAKEAYAEVTGVIDGDTIRVTSLKEVPKPPEPEKKRSARKKAEQ